jgi:hypothetical protein
MLELLIGLVGAGTIAIDFLTVTATFNVLYAFVVLSLQRRANFARQRDGAPLRSVGCATDRQGTEAPIRQSFEIRDRDGIYGSAFDARVEHLGIRQLVIAPQSLVESLDATALLSRWDGAESAPEPGYLPLSGFGAACALFSAAKVPASCAAAMARCCSQPICFTGSAR